MTADRENEAQMTLVSGTKLGRYEIRSQLGAGGMGEVYLAEDTRLHRKVALKILPADLAANKRFELDVDRRAEGMAALAECESVVEAAEKTGIPKRTLYRWLRQQRRSGLITPANDRTLSKDRAGLADRVEALAHRCLDQITQRKFDQATLRDLTWAAAVAIDTLSCSKMST